VAELIPVSALSPYNGVVGVATDGCGDVLVVADTVAGLRTSGVRRFDADGRFLSDVIPPFGPLVAGWSVEVDSTGNVYVTDQLTGVWKVLPDGTTFLLASLPGATALAICRDRFVPPCPRDPPACVLAPSLAIPCPSDLEPPGVQLDGSGSSAADDGPLEYSWTTDCPGGTFDDEGAAQPFLAVPDAPCDLECTVTLEVTSAYGVTSSCATLLSVADEVPPALSAPADLEVECPEPASGPGSEAEWLASAVATDACGEAVVLHRLVEEIPGCGGTVTRVHELWAVDECGLESARELRTYAVVDTTPPLLAAPADLEVECPEPASGPGSEAEWLASAVATDACGAAVVLHRLVEEIPGCGGTVTRVHELWAVDECGLESARELRTYRVVDTTPPSFSGGGEEFEVGLWPPGHGYVAFDVADLARATDACGLAVVLATGCASDQPEDAPDGRSGDAAGGDAADRAEANGDGHTDEDCVVSLDGTRFAARAERLGSCGTGSARTYVVELTATDECGNSASSAGRVVVGHDRAGGGFAVRGRWLPPGAPPPFPSVHATTYGAGCP
jgi:hypothetical protein